MILAGDVGGTKTVMALFSQEAGLAGGALHETRFASAQYDCLEAIVQAFLDATGARPEAACFGVAGPVSGGEAQITNLPWKIRSAAIRDTFGIPTVHLLNDLESLALAVPRLSSHDIHTLNPGFPEPGGNIAVVAPGTGLGAAFLVSSGGRYQACASEGGHAAFSPRSPQQTKLLQFLQQRYDPVSFERICSGGFLPNIYDFYREQGEYPEPQWLRDTLRTAPDPAPLIVQAALEEKSELCEATLEMFVHTLGTFVGNFAVTVLPKAGIYLGGGIPPKILSRLERPDFLEAVTDKGRFEALCSRIPLHVILDSGTALHGAAVRALEDG